MKQELEVEGDCYKANADFIIDLWMKHREERKLLQSYKLCHGMVIGAKGSKVEGLTFPHAWIEVDGKTLIDMSNGNKIGLPIERIKHRIVGEPKRYTPKEVVENILKYEHYGAWEE